MYLQNNKNLQISNNIQRQMWKQNQFLTNSLYENKNANKTQTRNINHFNRIIERRPQNTIQTHQFTHEYIILQKIHKVDQKNKQLIEISKRIRGTSAMNSMNQRNIPTIFYQVEEQLKISFNQLIGSIQQFYIDIDTKIKDIIEYYTTFLSNKKNIQHKPQDIFLKLNKSIEKNESLGEIQQKINVLQKELSQTKKNQKKLLSVLQKLAYKYSLNQQATFIKEDPYLWKKLSSISDKNIDNNVQYFNKNNGNTRQTLQFKNVITSHNVSNTENRNQIKLIKSLQKINGFQRNLIQSSLSSCQAPQDTNDHSFYEEFNKIQNPEKSQTQNHHHQKRLFLNFSSMKKDKKSANKLFTKFNQDINDNLLLKGQKARQYKNQKTQFDYNPNFIKKIYSKQNQSLTKISLKNCNNVLFQSKKTQSPIDAQNKAHRQTYLMRNLLK